MTKREYMLIYPDFFSKEEIKKEFPYGVHPRVNHLAVNLLFAVAGLILLFVILGLLTGRL